MYPTFHAVWIILCFLPSITKQRGNAEVMCKHFEQVVGQQLCKHHALRIWGKGHGRNCTQSCSCLSCHSCLQCSCSMFACNQSWNQTYTVSECPVSTPSHPTGHSHPTRRPLVNLVCWGFTALTEGDCKASSNIWLPVRVIHCEHGSLHWGCKGCYISDTRGDDCLWKDCFSSSVHHVTGSLQTVKSLKCAKILDYDGNRGKICYLGVFKRNLPKLHCN